MTNEPAVFGRTAFEQEGLGLAFDPSRPVFVEQEVVRPGAPRVFAFVAPAYDFDLGRLVPKLENIWVVLPFVNSGEFDCVTLRLNGDADFLAGESAGDIAFPALDVP